MGRAKTLELAKEITVTGLVTVILDSQATITRLHHAELGPGNELDLQAQTAARKLAAAAGRKPVI